MCYWLGFPEIWLVNIENACYNPPSRTTKSYA